MADNYLENQYERFLAKKAGLSQSGKKRKRAVPLVKEEAADERKLICLVAQSVDGYMADAQGGVKWLEQVNMGSYSLDLFMQRIDTVIMGWTTYKQIVTELSPKKWPYSGQMTYVLTHHVEVEPVDGVVFCDEAAASLMSSLREAPGKHIWLVGGSNVIGQFLAAGLIDEFHISTLPVLLGDGVRLFDGSTAVSLDLMRSMIYGDVVESIYRVKNHVRPVG